jgi:two-component system sensor kinase FixL
MATTPARDLEHTHLGSRAQAFARRMRVRVGVTVCWVLIALSALFALKNVITQHWLFAAQNLATVVVVGVLLHLFRRRRNPTLPAALLLGWMLLGQASVGITQQGLPLVTSIWSGVVALLALYLLGPRHGALVVAIFLAEIAALWALHQSGVRLPHAELNTGSRWAIVFDAIGVALVALIGYLYEAAQRRSLGELAEALIASEQNERQLDALFESSTSAICSLDRDRRLLACNHAFAAMVRPGAPEPSRGQALQELLSPAQYARWKLAIERVLEGGSGPTSFEESPPPGQDGPYRETVMHPLASGLRVTGVTVFCRDITPRKRAESELRRVNQELVRVSREAGMAVVASEVLHNAGNVLNSTGVSVAMLEHHVKQLKTEHLSRAVGLLEQHQGTLDAYLRDDPAGRRLLELLRGLAEHFGEQQRQLTGEILSLREHTEHLTRVIQAQRSHARVLGIVEMVSVEELIAAALELQAPPWEQLGIVLERRIGAVPPLHLDRHKVIEILINLVGNARHALRDSGRPDKRLRIRAEPVPGATATERVRIHVEDNGVGIAPEHRDQLFRLGFTTKRDGNGIGLHASAIAAQQLGGSLCCHSDGPGRGATFTLELPLAPPAPQRAALP